MRPQIIKVFVLAAGAAFVLRDFLFTGRNIDERKEYWGKEISTSLKAGSSKEELLAFAKAHGQNLNCYQNFNQEDQCDFTDVNSIGGTSSRPVKLAVIFAIKDEKLVSHQITTTLANSPE